MLFRSLEFRRVLFRSELKAQYDTEGRRLDVLIKADLESYKELLKGADQNV